MHLKSINTERLCLRQIQNNDFEFILKYLSDDERTKYLPLERPYNEDEAYSWFKGRMQHWERHGFGTFLLSLKNASDNIGYCGLEYVRETDFIDIRYGLLQSAWGKGYAFEAAFSILKYGFEELTLSIIYGAAVSENYPSIKLLKNLGMEPDEKFDSYGNVVDPYSIRKDIFIKKFAEQDV